MQRDPSLTPARLEAALKTSPKRITDTRNGLSFPRLDCGAALASLDTTCTPESNTVFCSRLGKNCGAVSAPDNCGQTRSVSSCGSCTSPRTCDGAGTPNVWSGDLHARNECGVLLANLSGTHCGNFANRRTFRVNNVPVTCNGGNITLPGKRNDGYCFQASAGDFPWAYFTTW